jgi:hypothetical protein
MKLIMDQINRAPTPEAKLGVITKLSQRDFEQLDPRAQEAITELRRRVGGLGLSPAALEAQERRVTRDSMRLPDLEDEVRAREDAVQRAEDRVSHLRTRNEQDDFDVMGQRNFADQLDTDLSEEEDRLRRLDQEASDIRRSVSDLDLRGTKESGGRKRAELNSVLSRSDELRKQIAGLKGATPSQESIESLRRDVDSERQKLADTDSEIDRTRERVGEVTETGRARAMELEGVRKQSRELASAVGKLENEELRDIGESTTQLGTQQKLQRKHKQEIASLSVKKRALEDQMRSIERQLKRPDDSGVHLRKARDASSRLSNELSGVQDELGRVNRSLANLPKIQKLESELENLRDERVSVDDELNHYRSEPPPNYADIEAELDRLELEIRGEDEIRNELDAAPDYDLEIAERDRELADESQLTSELESLERNLSTRQKEERALSATEERLIKSTQNISAENQGVATGDISKYGKAWLDWAGIRDEPSKTERELSSELQELRRAPAPDIVSAEKRLMDLQRELDVAQRDINGKQRRLNELTKAQLQSAARKTELAKRVAALRKAEQTISGRKGKLKATADQISATTKRIAGKMQALPSMEEELSAGIDEVEKVANRADYHRNEAERLFRLRMLTYTPQLLYELDDELELMQEVPSPSLPDDYLDNMMGILKRNYPKPIEVTPEFQNKLNALGLFDPYLYFHYIQGAAKMLRLNPMDWQIRDATFRLPFAAWVPQAEGLRNVQSSYWGKHEILGLNEAVDRRISVSGVEPSEYLNNKTTTVISRGHLNTKLPALTNDYQVTLYFSPIDVAGRGTVGDHNFFTALDNYQLHAVASPLARAHWLAVANYFFTHKLPIQPIRVMGELDDYKASEGKIAISFRIDDVIPKNDPVFPEAAEALKQELQTEVDEFKKNPNAGLVTPLFPPIPTPAPYKPIPERFNALLRQVQDLHRALRAAINVQTDQRERQLLMQVEQNVRQNLEEIPRAWREGNAHKAYSLLHASGSALSHLRFRGG